MSVALGPQTERRQDMGGDGLLIITVLIALYNELTIYMFSLV